MNRRILMALLAAACWPALAQTAEPVATNLPPHPRLMFDRAGLDQFRAKIAAEPWRGLWKKRLAGLDRELSKPVALPPRGGNWSHNYVCPTHGARLSQGKALGPWQWEHTCPVGPHTLHGDPAEGRLDFDGNAIMGAHGAYAGQVRQFGLAYAVTGDRRYADRAKAILLAYAETYLTYPLHDNRGRTVTKGGARVASQSLSEATWLTPMLQGADFVWDAMSAAEREAVERKLIRPALDETIRNPGSKPTIHNIQCHRNSTVGLAGFLLGDRALIAEAIDGRSGYRVNMARGVQPDGVWFEGSWGYHFFTIGALWPLTEAARNCGIDLYGPEMKRLFDAPLRLATPDLRLPAFNDSGEVSLAGRADDYELAFARYHDPAYAPLILGGKRTGELALWFGANEVKGAGAPVAGSRNAEASGYAILQRGAGPDAAWVCLKYGPHGGGHGHNDKNNAVLIASRRWVLPDVGSHAYGSPLHASWDKTSFAHNTLVVDQISQAEATGRCLAFGSQGGVDYAMTDAGAIYPGVRFVRTVAMADTGLVVFVDHVTADQPRTLDLVCHVTGAWKDLPAGTAFACPSAPGYSEVRDATTRSGDTGLALTVAGGGTCDVRLLLAAGVPTETITGTGVGKSTADRVPLAVFRRIARATTFVWAVALDGAPVRLDAKTDPQGVTTVAVAGPRAWRIVADPARGAVKADLLGNADR